MYWAANNDYGVQIYPRPTYGIRDCYDQVFSRILSQWDHLQNDLEKIVEKHSCDPNGKNFFHPAKDFFRGLLGVVIAIPTLLGLVSSTYRNFLVRTFFRTILKPFCMKQGKIANQHQKKLVIFVRKIKPS